MHLNYFSSLGRSNEFYFGFFYNHANSLVGLSLMTTDTKSVSFSIEASQYHYSGTIAPNGRTTVNIPTRFIVSTSNIQSNGIFLQTSSDKVTVVGQNLRSTSTSDTFTILPVVELCTESYVYYGISVQRTSVFRSSFLSAMLIVATKNYTLLRITPTRSVRMLIKGYSYNFAANEEGRVWINRLDIAYIVTLDELTGTKIVSNHPVSVFSGHECGNVPSHIAACDHMTEQIPPTTLWGRVHYVVPFLGRNSYTIKVVAANDSTAVDMYCGNTMQSYTLNEGNAVTRVLSVYCAIYSTKVVLVAQFSHGQQDDSLNGDPMMIIVPATAHYTNMSDITTMYNSASGFNHYASIIVPAQFYQPQMIYLTTGGVKNSLQSASWIPIQVESANVAYATRVSISDGLSFIVHTGTSALMTVIVYGFYNYESYGHAGLNLFMGMCIIIIMLRKSYKFM